MEIGSLQLKSAALMTRIPKDGAGNDLRLPPRTEEEIERQKRRYMGTH